MPIVENPLINLEGLNVFKEEIEAEISGSSGSLSAPITATKTVGGITSGTTYAADTGFEEMWRDMLNPTENPTLTAPSAAITVSGGTLVESGASVEKTFTVTFNRGSITPPYGTSGYRSGEATGYSLNGGAEKASGTFTETVNETNKTFKASVSYAEGPQPKNSAGQNYSTPLPAGSVNSNTITFEFVNPLYSNATNNAVIAKEALISKSAKSKEFNFAASTASTPEVFDVSSSWTVQKIEVLNELSGKWENCANEFSISNVTHKDAGNTDVEYKRYSDNRGYASGARKIKLTWS